MATIDEKMGIGLDADSGNLKNTADPTAAPIAENPTKLVIPDNVKVLSGDEVKQVEPEKLRQLMTELVEASHDEPAQWQERTRVRIREALGKLSRFMPQRILDVAHPLPTKAEEIEWDIIGLHDLIEQGNAIALQVDGEIAGISRICRYL